MERYSRRREFLADSGKKMLAGFLLPKNLTFFEPLVPPTEPEPEPLAEITPLQRHLENIREEQTHFREIISQHQLFETSIQHQMEDFDIYFPIYKAGEMQYGIPWFLLWIIHFYETTASRDKNPEGGGHWGAMQLAYMHLDKEIIQNAAVRWEFLDELPQRYSTKNGWKSNDWEEILKAAAFIRWRSGWGENWAEDEAKILPMVEEYSNKVHGKARVKKYQELKKVFGWK